MTIIEFFDWWGPSSPSMQKSDAACLAWHPFPLLRGANLYFLTSVQSPLSYTGVPEVLWAPEETKRKEAATCPAQEVLRTEVGNCRVFPSGLSWYFVQNKYRETHPLVQGIVELAWPSCLAGYASWVFRLESKAPGAPCAFFQFLRILHTPSGSEAFRLLYASLSVPLEVKEAWKPDRIVCLRY